ncbi:hypothetical protein [Priestia megaterium]|jgi:hypothetical protein|uniref:hypothetical protein n=1 Tax=Priestia megaterium TaxID=1404 RepID=UPI001C52B823|nr:hypothetical protein [Priestia megaterium]MBW0933935.1 hypothetical protein [Priestia megaterium]
MGRISRFVKTIFLKEYQVFAEELGFKSWDETLENTYEIFKMPPDASYLVTQSKEDKWIVWNDEGSLPYSYLVFSTWFDAIGYLRKIFEEGKYEEYCWEPEGFDPGENVFENGPNKEKNNE